MGGTLIGGAGGLSFPRLLLHRPHADPNQPDEPQALLTVMDQHRLQETGSISLWLGTRGVMCFFWPERVAQRRCDRMTTDSDRINRPHVRVVLFPTSRPFTDRTPF